MELDLPTWVGILQKGSEGVCSLIPMHTEEPHALCPGLFLSLVKIKENIFQIQESLSSAPGNTAEADDNDIQCKTEIIEM